MSNKRNRGLQFYKKKKKINKGIVKEVFSWLTVIGIAVFLACAGNYFYGTTIPMVGVSMEPTLLNEQRVMIDKFCYVLGSPDRGDVVAFLPNGNVNSHYYVKRVVGIPGDEIKALDGLLYVNGELCPFLTDKLEDAGIAEAGITLEKGHYFLLGDNPNNSEDSRSPNIGPVALDSVLGRVWFKRPYKDSSMGFVSDTVSGDLLTYHTS